LGGEVIPASDIDRLLLSCCGAHWRKVARIIGQTYEILEDHGNAISSGIAKLMDARMAILVRSGKLEAKGNINRWGYNEVRLAALRQTRRLLKPVLPRRGAEPQKKKRCEATEQAYPGFSGAKAGVGAPANTSFPDFAPLNPGYTPLSPHPEVPARSAGLEGCRRQCLGRILRGALSARTSG
jgi:hypothetical protein